MLNNFEATENVSLSVFQMKQAINNYYPNFDFERILSRQDVLDVFNRMIVNGQYNLDVMDELDDQVRKRSLPYNMNSILTMIYEGVNLLLTSDANTQAYYKQLQANRNCLDLLQYRGDSNYLIINTIKIPSSFFPQLTQYFSVIISVCQEDQIKRTYDTKTIRFNENTDTYFMNEQIEITNFSDDCRIVIYGERQEQLGYIQFKFCNLNFQQTIYDSQSTQYFNLYKIINEYQQDSAQTSLSLSLSVNNIESAKIQLIQELQLYENDMVSFQQNYQKLVQPFQQQRPGNFINDIPQNLIPEEQVQRARQNQNPISQNQSMINDISIAPDRGTMNPFQPDHLPQIQPFHKPAEFELHIVFIIYLGIACLFGGKKSNMIDICICLYFLSQLFIKDQLTKDYELLKKRTFQALICVLVYDLFWMIIIGSHWLAREQSDDQGIQNTQRVLTFIATLLLLIFRGFLAFLLHQTNLEEFPLIKSKFQEFLLLKSEQNKETQNQEQLHL
ncbi:transmembrane protein, putative (macronuclear) [Tetrahymena thermophila SB210]|uniref:Transmembrane protein, putative n=1 Tax=Tetrahymena thermophila (strain SB210) TaxID=312017 RepID=A4VCQ8_TETTS|nr:transmembrane protein, putative [Tetrahymena thermophila SB210]EDK31313.2 transmembrane protein, putative [Tetrahymena thermophila SB210]|eukprot:XP_001471482.2 transmembrane protein, putative [Tetrahymena thermophila SB210]